jgi:hypothetical protein
MSFTNMHRALALAEAGFHVFPLEEDGKLPIIKDFPNRATRDRALIEKWWSGNSTRNIGISTTRYGDDKSLVVVDVDNKHGKNGGQRLIELELEGCEFPVTMEQETPTGGKHLIYITDFPLRQGVNTLGDGLDIRSKGGFIVGPGSRIGGKRYRLIHDWLKLTTAPQWLVDKLGRARTATPLATTVLAGVDPDRAEIRGQKYLESLPVASAGELNDACYRAAAGLKDLGCSEMQANALIVEFWRAEPFPPFEDIEPIIKNAFRYGREAQGSLAPEAVFEAVQETGVLSPLESVNQEYAFVKDGGFILEQRIGMNGLVETKHHELAKFHAWYSNQPLAVGDKIKPISKWWMEWQHRRQYEALVFMPGKDAGPRWFNLWRGYSVAPSATATHPSVQQFLEHAFENVCNRDEKLFKWLMAWFAHLFQHPGVKPLTAPVFKGRKGTGKNALVEFIGRLIKQHFLVASNDRYLLSNFNSHMESLLLFVLDEASWAGDKKAEGRLKDLITGSEHIIERKGFEPYRVANLTRVCIIGNEDWLVPATQDERRFAVFNVGDGRKGDTEYFERMRIGLENGGYECLLRYFLDFDLSKVNVNVAPVTQGLIQQKHQSLPPLQEWWLDCLESNEIIGDDFEGAIPQRVPTNRLENAFKKWARGKNIRSRLPGRKTILKDLRVLSPSFRKNKVWGETEDSTYACFNPGIEIMRAEWDTFIGGKHTWSDEDEGA